MKRNDPNAQAFVLPMDVTYEWVKKERIEKTPFLCSTDLASLQDGDDSELIRLFGRLLDVGIKEFSLGTYSGSDRDIALLKKLICTEVEPFSVTICLVYKGEPGDLSRLLELVTDVFRLHIEVAELSDEDLCKIAQMITPYGPNVSLILNNSMRADTLHDYLAVADHQLELVRPTEQQPVILKLFSVPERMLPHIFATMVEYVSAHLHCREGVILSLDSSGASFIDAEPALLAGLDRVEGKILAGKEQISEFDLSFLIHRLLMYMTDCFINEESLADLYKEYRIHAFKDHAGHSLLSDVDEILIEKYGISLPDKMKEELCESIKEFSVREHKELTSKLIFEYFKNKYINKLPYFRVDYSHFKHVDGILAETAINHAGKTVIVNANGNHRLDAVSNCIKQYFGIDYEVVFYEEYAVSFGFTSKSMAYVGISHKDHTYWGVGTDEDIITSSIHALCVAVNQIEAVRAHTHGADDRLMEVMNYIQTNYLTVTLEELAMRFHLSEPYLSKYIKEKSGRTFGENLKNIRMNRARSLLKNSSMTVEQIAYAVGYQNVEHFDRIFKKNFDMTPIQYRNSKKA